MHTSNYRFHASFANIVPYNANKSIVFEFVFLWFSTYVPHWLPIGSLWSWLLWAHCIFMKIPMNICPARHAQQPSKFHSRETVLEPAGSIMHQGLGEFQPAQDAVLKDAILKHTFSRQCLHNASIYASIQASIMLLKHTASIYASIYATLCSHICLHIC